MADKVDFARAVFSAASCHDCLTMRAGDFARSWSFEPDRLDCHHGTVNMREARYTISPDDHRHFVKSFLLTQTVVGRHPQIRFDSRPNSAVAHCHDDLPFYPRSGT